MQSFNKESTLLEPVRCNLRRRGYRQLRSEVGFFEYSMDLYGYAAREERTIAVELKLTRWKRALEQAVIYQLCSDLVYLALPIVAAGRVDVSLLQREGIGLIGVHPGFKCETLVEAEQSHVVDSGYRDFYVRMLKGGIE